VHSQALESKLCKSYRSCPNQKYNLRTITSWNVNGLFKKSTSQKLCKLDDNNFSKYMQSDIICLSETHAHSKDILQYVGYYKQNINKEHWEV
jgi:exonuclease III